MNEIKKRTTSLDGHFLKADIYEYPNGERRIDAVYLASANKFEVILTKQFASQELFSKAFVDGPLVEELSANARKLVPAIGMREKKNLSEMADLQFEARDVGCCGCGAWPGAPCSGGEHCQESRVEGLHHFLIWLAEQRHCQTNKPTKKLIIEVAEMLGYNTAENLYHRGHGVVLTRWSTGECWRLYIGGRIDPTKSVWMTSGSDLSNPERGPFRDAKEIALAIRAVGRGKCQ